ncbi:putative oxidoreductase [Caenibius tardaugens NBRC 16725]|uniref:Putative oxidoreductase n=1 Tax=Caenibius tardaugens NBRC 16725 TaxID=1219035 RepID=U2Y411_9SPHN|nr:SDR family NAD(P)-dependent oxidoreductase [Caenibius tardaugens]AZI37008.1 SDR family NAD(P)-dependent oxidoreductase [Caenibius tardaugens NBRC 16725]GAD47771.1 putative oxidoreductase [Caenibius tardaugens NBRC 16725]
MEESYASQGPSLAGKVALVTGASRGIGRAIAQRFASAGALVVVTARSLDRPVEGADVADGTLRETVELVRQAGGSAIAIAADLENPDDRARLLEAAVSQAGGIDILVNNAGLTRFAASETMPAALLERTIDHYFRIPFLLSQAVIPQMKARGRGWIINLGSVAALRPMTGHNLVLGDTVYAASKAALARLTQGLAAELQADNIAVNLVAPSTAVRTPGGKDIIPDDFPTEDVEYLAATALAMAHLPASERTGQLAFSMHYANETDLVVHSLDGRDVLPRRLPPDWAHPDIAFSSRVQFQGHA